MTRGLILTGRLKIDNKKLYKNHFTSQLKKENIIMEKHISQKQIKKIETFVQSKIDQLNWQHTIEVRKYGQELARLEKANQEVVEVAALFHDCAKLETNTLEHAKRGAEIAKKFLTRLNLEQNFIQMVYDCVLCHSSPWISGPPWNQKTPQPETIEAKVLFDADMLAQMSQTGICKNLFEYRDKGEDLLSCARHAYRDIKHYAFKNLLTKNGQKIGQQKFKYVQNFFGNIIEIKTQKEK